MAREMTEQHHDREVATGATRESFRPARAPSGLARRSGVTPDAGGFGSQLTLVQRMADDLNRLLDDFGLGRGLASTALPMQSLWNPQVEMVQRGDRLVVRADLPGMKKDDVHVDVEDGLLTIRGERREERSGSEDGFYRTERSYGEFYRAIPLPEGVDAEKCDARYEDGVLEVTMPMPKREERKGKRIRIR